MLDRLFKHLINYSLNLDLIKQSLDRSEKLSLLYSISFYLAIPYRVGYLTRLLVYVPACHAPKKHDNLKSTKDQIV